MRTADDDRTRAALVGLAKAGSDAAKESVVSRSGDTPETRFLLAAAADAVRRAAGRPPDPAPDPPPACDDVGAPAPPAGLAALAVEVCERHGEVLRELCDRLAARGLSLPPAALPAAFAAPVSPGRGNHAAAKRAVAAAAGPRGRWLAARNPDWAWVTEETPDLFADDATAAPPNASAEDFAEGFAADHFGARLAAFGRWRQVDPAAARDALEEVWRGETAFRRAALLESMAAGLSPDDEPFLAAARDDRSKAVPAAAEELLLRLTDSAHARAIRAAADRLLDFADDALSVTLPPDEGEAVGRRRRRRLGRAGDGRNRRRPRPPGRPAGAGGGVRPALALVRAVLGDPGGVGRRGGRGRTRRRRARRLAGRGRPLRRDRPGRPPPTGRRRCRRGPPSDWTVRGGEGKNEPAPDGDVSAFVAALPPAGAAAFIAPLLRTAAVARDPAGVGAPLWSAAPDPWPDDFGRAVAAAVDAAGDRGFEYHLWHAALPEVLTRLPPAVLDDLPPDWPTPGGAPRWLERAAASARLRRRLHDLLP